MRWPERLHSSARPCGFTTLRPTEDVMSSRPLTIGETVSELQVVLRDYIEATYHVKHPKIVEQRRALLEVEGVLHQTPYIESTPRYVLGVPFEELAILQQARDLLTELSTAVD